MRLRALLPEIFGTQRLQLASVLAKEQAFRFKSQFRNHISRVRTFGTKNLNVFTNSWKQRLKENNIPEGNLTVKFIIEHVLGKKRTWVRTRDYYYNSLPVEKCLASEIS